MWNTLSKLPRGLWAVMVVALIAVAAWAASSKPKDPAGTAAAQTRPALTVTVAHAARTTLPTVIKASGAIAAWQEGSIGARISGLPVVLVNVNVGDVIKKGQVLARLDDATVRTELTQAQANLTQAQASAQQAEANRDRALALKASGALSEQDILQNTTVAATARAQVSQATAALAAAQLKLQYTALTAPDDGVISARIASLGMVSQAGTEMFRFIRQSRLEWRAELNATQVTQVTPGLSVRLQLPGGQSVGGRIRQIAPSLSADTRLVIAYADLDPSTAARAGMFASGDIVKEVSEAVTVPAESVVIRDGRSYVMRLQGTRAQQVAVSTGRRQGSVTEILSGIREGEIVVARGAGFINDNDVVRIAGDADVRSDARSDAGDGSRS
jgi:RND family efflux transporter MFP subunit